MTIDEQMNILIIVPRTVPRIFTRLQKIVKYEIHITWKTIRNIAFLVTAEILIYSSGNMNPRNSVESV